MLKVYRKLLICLFAFSAGETRAFEEYAYARGFVCRSDRPVSEWNDSEKELLRKTVGTRDADYFFVVADKVIHKEDSGEEICGYRSNVSIVSFYEPKDRSQNVARIRIDMPLIRPANAASYEYQFYYFRGDDPKGKGTLISLFRFEFEARRGMMPLASFSHQGFLSHGSIFWAVAVVKLKSGKSLVYAQKTAPK